MTRGNREVGGRSQQTSENEEREEWFEEEEVARTEVNGTKTVPEEH